MSLWAVVVLGISVSIDAFAVALSGALTDREHPHIHALLAALFFGGFQFVMPLLGYFAGSLVASAVAAGDHWVAFALLLGVGGNMIYGAWQEPKAECPARSPFALKSLWVLAVATSLDALAVGASLAMVKDAIFFPALMMGIITAIGSILGVFLGFAIGCQFKCERWMTTLAGLAIAGIGVKILCEHLFN